MASDMFLKIDGIKGESNDDKYKDQIEVLSFSWGAHQQSSEPNNCYVRLVASYCIHSPLILD